MGILPLLVTGFLAIQAHSASEKVAVPPRTIMMSTVKAGLGVSCTVRVDEVAHPDTGIDQKLTIQCDDNTTMIYDFPLSGINGLTAASDDSGRIAVDWERGTGAAITIFQIRTVAGKTSANKVFEHFSKCGGEAFEGMDVVLAEVGRRFVGSEILPAGTNVYRWKDGKYVFSAGYLWNTNASWSDRYCVLTPSTICPAATKLNPIPDTH